MTYVLSSINILVDKLDKKGTESKRESKESRETGKSSCSGDFFFFIGGGGGGGGGGGDFMLC